MKQLLTTFKKAALVITVMAVAFVVIPHAAFAETAQESLCKGAQGTGGASNPDGSGGCSGSGPTVMGVIGAITDLLLYLAGAIAVVMIILGGIRYASSNGDQNAVTGAKNTIMYAVIGLVVTILAYAIVHFVLTNIK
jgi:hypothetical protein